MELKLEAKNAVEMRLLEYLTANASEALAEKINAGAKTLAGAVRHATEEARKIADGAGSVCVDDATVFGWVVHYFEADSIKETKAATRVKTAAPAPKVKKSRPKRYDVAAKEQELLEAAKVPDGPVQLDLFGALLGGTPA